MSKGIIFQKGVAAFLTLSQTAKLCGPGALEHHVRSGALSGEMGRCSDTRRPHTRAGKPTPPSQSWGHSPQLQGLPSQHPPCLLQDSPTQEAPRPVRVEALHALHLPEISSKCGFIKLMSGGASGFNRAVSRWSLDTTLPYWTWVAPPSPTSCSLPPVPGLSLFLLLLLSRCPFWTLHSSLREPRSLCELE